MKKLALLIFLGLIQTLSAKAQKVAFIDSDYILSQVPEYISAQKQLDATADLWQKDVDARQREIDKLKKALQADLVLLNEELKARREEEIALQEQQLRDFQKTRFGFDGDLFKERKKLMKPIQEKLSNAIREVSEIEQVEIMLDKCSAEGLVLFAVPKYDMSDQVLRKMGYKPAEGK